MQLRDIKNFKDVKNYFFPQAVTKASKAGSPNTFISPVQFARVRVDIEALRDAISEAEQAYYPHRVKLQRIFQDTIRNGQVSAAINKRKELTLLKDFEVRIGETVDEKATELLRQEWFYQLMDYCFDAKFYGYTLVGLGDMVNNSFPNIQLVKRWNVSPDRHNITNYVYSLSGIDFLNPEIKDEAGNSFYDWTVWVDTQSETGASNCGYGLLYKIAYYEILIRYNTGYNATFLELFGQPIRVGTTTKTDEFERAEFATALQNFGASAWMMKDPTDEVELLEATSGGSGKNNGFENFELRQLKMINKIVFGHSDALDSQTGKLGGEDSALEAIKNTEKVDNRWMENIANANILPKLINLGLPLPLGGKLHIINNREQVEARKAQDEANKITAEIAQAMNNAGLKMDPKYFEERTGIPTTEAEIEAPEPLKPEQKQKLKNLYNAK